MEFLPVVIRADYLGEFLPDEPSPEVCFPFAQLGDCYAPLSRTQRAVRAEVLIDAGSLTGEGFAPVYQSIDDAAPRE